MSNDCLLLNGNGKPVSYFPLSTIDWKTAIRLLFIFLFLKIFSIFSIISYFTSSGHFGDIVGDEKVVGSPSYKSENVLFLLLSNIRSKNNFCPHS